MVWIAHALHVKSADFGSLLRFILLDEALRTKVKEKDISLIWINS